MSQNDRNVAKESEELFSTEDLLNGSEILHKNAAESDQTEEIVMPASEEVQIVQLDDHQESEEEIEDEEVHEEEEHDDEVAEEDKENTEDPTSENIAEKSSKTTKKPPAADRLTELPLSKIKNMIKLDPEVQLVSSKFEMHGILLEFVNCKPINHSILDEAVYLITKATENFIKSLSKESATLALQQKKKTVAKTHVDFALTMLPIEL